MIARKRWYALTPDRSINADDHTAEIVIDSQMLDAILRTLQRSVSYAVDAGKYNDALEMLQCYIEMEELQLALKELEGDKDEA